MGKLLSQDQIDSYERDGFLSPVDIFTEAEAAEMRGRLEAAEAKWPEAFEGPARNNPHYNLTVFDEIVHNETLVDAVEDLIGPDILCFGSVLFIKEPHDPGYVSWHQDARYMGLAPHDGVTAWVALSPATVESGCMRMIPGSHKDPMYEHTDTFADDNLLTRGQDIVGLDESKAVDTPLRPGQVSFHCKRVIHGSNPNRSDDRRIGLAIQAYLPPHVRQTITPTRAQLVRGNDTHGHFELAPRPTVDMGADSVAIRDEVNAAWSEILYAGAEKRRNL